MPRFYRCLIVLVLILSISRPTYALEIFEFDFPRIFPAEREMMMDTEKLEPFLDEFFAREMERLQIPGATFSLVEGQKLVFSKGYGWCCFSPSCITGTYWVSVFRNFKCFFGLIISREML